MTSIALSRFSAIARRAGRREHATRWSALAYHIRSDVLTHGYSERLGTFRQRYGADTLDAASLLVPITGLLPASDARVVSTIDRVARDLTLDDFVYRFDPATTPGTGGELGEFEGAFVPCTCWLAHAYVHAGQLDRAEALLQRVERMIPATGLLAEAVDPRQGSWLGNTPLLFSHAAYALAVLALEKATA
jgi:GH15 family glucan-1,4-alpha-glucosidase